MAESKISDLSALAYTEVTGSDLLVIVDTSADETKKVSVNNMEGYFFTKGDQTISVDSVTTNDLTSANDITVNGSGNIFSTLISDISSNSAVLQDLGGSFVTTDNTSQDVTGTKVFDANIGFNSHISVGQNGGTDLESASLSNNTLAALEVHNVVDSTSIYASNDIVAFSDISVKENIRPIPHAIQKVKKLNGRLYTRNDCEDPEKIHMGLIAQEVDKVIPEVVKDLPEGKKAVAYQNIIGLLIEAIKDQQKQIDELKRKIK